MSLRDEAACAEGPEADRRRDRRAATPCRVRLQRDSQCPAWPLRARRVQRGLGTALGTAWPLAEFSGKLGGGGGRRFGSRRTRVLPVSAITCAVCLRVRGSM